MQRAIWALAMYGLLALGGCGEVLTSPVSSARLQATAPQWQPLLGRWQANVDGRPLTLTVSSTPVTQQPNQEHPQLLVQLDDGQQHFELPVTALWSPPHFLLSVPLPSSFATQPSGYVLYVAQVQPATSMHSAQLALRPWRVERLQPWLGEYVREPAACRQEVTPHPEESLQQTMQHATNSTASAPCAAPDALVKPLELTDMAKAAALLFAHVDDIFPISEQQLFQHLPFE